MGRDIGISVEIMVEDMKQGFNDEGLGEFLWEQGQSGVVGNVILDSRSKKSGEREGMTHLIFDLLVREIVKRLQDEHSEQHDRIDRLLTGHTFALCLRGQHRSLNVFGKALPWQQPGDGFKRVALRRECRKPLISIEKAELPHRESQRIMQSNSKLA